MNDVDNFLAHYGVPGMKWGKKKAQSIKDNHNSPINVRNRALKKDDKVAVKYRRVLSDQQLQTRISRLQKEKKLKELTNDDLRPGRKIAKSLTSQAGQRIVSGLLVGAMAYGVKAAVDQSFDKKEMFDYLKPANPNKKKK